MNIMKKAGLIIMIITGVIMITFAILWYHPVTDNAVDSNGFWSYMYGTTTSNPWPVFLGGVFFLMGLLVFLSGLEQKSERVN